MKIAILVIGFPPQYVGGTETQASGIASHLAARHDVWVFTRAVRGAPMHERRDGFTISRIPFINITGPRYFSYMISAFNEIRKRGPFDVLQCMYLVPNGVVGVMAKRLLRIPVAAWERGNSFYIRRGICRLASDFVMRGVDAVIVQSGGQKEEIERLYGLPAKKISVIPNAVDMPGTRAKGNCLLYLGRLAPVKGPEYLIEALKLMKNPPETLMVGDGPERKKLEQLAAGLPVKFIGHVEPEDAVKWLMKGSFLVLPSLSEGMPNAVLEAMSVGLPVIASSVGAVPEVVNDGKTGFLVEPRNVKQLAEKISLLAGDKKLRARMSKAALEEIKSYSWPVLVKKLESVYEKLTSSRP